MNLFGYLQLMRTDGRPSPRGFDIKQRTVTIGSSEKCSITIKREGVEPAHARITVDPNNQLWLSKVGKGWEMIKVNGSPLPTAKVKLYHKDTFSISSRSFTLFVPNGDDGRGRKEESKESESLNLSLDLIDFRDASMDLAVVDVDIEAVSPIKAKRNQRLLQLNDENTALAITSLQKPEEGEAKRRDEKSKAEEAKEQRDERGDKEEEQKDQDEERGDKEVEESNQQEGEETNEIKDSSSNKDNNTEEQEEESNKTIKSIKNKEDGGDKEDEDKENDKGSGDLDSSRESNKSNEANESEDGRRDEVKDNSIGHKSTKEQEEDEVVSSGYLLFFPKEVKEKEGNEEELAKTLSNKSDEKIELEEQEEIEKKMVKETAEEKSNSSKEEENDSGSEDVVKNKKRSRNNENKSGKTTPSKRNKHKTSEHEGEKKRPTPKRGTRKREVEESEGEDESEVHEQSTKKTSKRSRLGDSDQKERKVSDKNREVKGKSRETSSEGSLFMGLMFFGTMADSSVTSAILKNGGKFLESNALLAHLSQLASPCYKPKKSRRSGASKSDDEVNYDSDHSYYNNKNKKSEKSPKKTSKAFDYQHTTFLLALEPKRSPKYFFALAHGIPCVEFRWIFSCIEAEELLPFEEYLLPAGRSLLLNKDLPQHVDATHKRQDSLDNLRIETLVAHAGVGGMEKRDKGRDKLREDTELIRMAMIASGAKPTRRLSLGTHGSVDYFLCVRHETKDNGDDVGLALADMIMSIVTMTWFAECLIQRRHVDEAKHPDFAYDLSPAYKILKKEQRKK